MKYLLFLIFPFLLYAQQTAIVDITTISAVVTPDTTRQQISGTVSVSFTMLEDAQKVYLDAVAMEPVNPDNTAYGNIEVHFADDKIWFHSDFEKGYEYNIRFDYIATPKKALYFVEDQIWTQGQGKNTSYWLPSIDDMNDKIEFDLTVVVPKHKTVVSNGLLKNKVDTEDHIGWFFDMEQPMSSYLVAFAVGNFKETSLFSKNGTPLKFFISEKDALKAEPTYRYSKEIFDFLEDEIGVAYPWQSYKQVPVRDFLYAGMENTGSTLFSEAFVVDSLGFVDRNYVNVNAHELAHQWFGNLVTETSSKHHWLHEGFATYYALLAERFIFGEAYYYWKLFQSANSLIELSEQGKGQSLLDPKASSLIFYEKGAWALHMLRERIGDDAFRMAIHSYLEKYQFKNVTTTNFLDEVKASTTVSIATWEKDWLQQTAFKATQAYTSLIASPFMKSYFELASMAPDAFADKKHFLETALTFPNDYIGQEVVYQLSRENFETVLPLYKKAFDSNNLFVRQAIALAQDGPIPNAIKDDFESLLEDPSYVTQETALLKLWQYFPADRRRYLDATKSRIGFQDRNLRQLWLVLAANTKGYTLSEKATFVKELKGYTAPNYSFEVREIAFEHLKTLSLWDTETAGNLLQAATHHYWRFREVARKLLDSLLKEDTFQKLIGKAASNAGLAEISYLERIGFSLKK